MAFISGPDGDLKTSFVSDAFLLDQFVGNTLFTWGRNAYGEVGDNTASSKSNPIQTVTGGINWKQVACGSYFTAAIKTDNTLWSWGRGDSGQLGDNTNINRSSPVQTVTFGTDWKQVSTCASPVASANAAIKTDGTLWCWGKNAYGQLGDNTIADKSSPVQTIAYGINWKQVACGMYHTAAIKTDGTLWCWGGNNGKLGDNTTANKSSPVQTIAYGTNWKQVACSQYNTAAVKTDGTLWCWGAGTNGRLGNNTTTDRSSPVQTITFGTNWKQVACGNGHTAAVKTDGTLWCWGDNAYGRLGDNTTINKSSPVQTITFGTNWKQVSAGYTHTAAIKTDGTLWTWGRNNNNQLGDSTTTNRSSPVQTSAYGTNWKQVTCGNYHTAAVTNGDI